ncbi:hypothetical protein [Pseudobacteroides cellulosolvens]|uniref:Sodium:dicarboxylate symporter n=1 Tax=Pseudobacteroides cellulosolvens ATCC 35603 = DSM 2933 TaxID=398512 RepID=A0A0L6JRQ0_9FIRM|nr:hypothetical protein [Pseudobacteroides cellulosolvens]KNY28072.1 sodium:dicarboxylate symporter [Pseudobacteroides cellulosolvens ATCC 35603 = DSM 2933]
MMQKTWFKIFIWFLASFFFFLASGVVISIFRPGPTEAEVMKFMMGMMSAMNNSMMGVAMNLENHSPLKNILIMSSSLTLPIIVLSIIIGLLVRSLKRGDKNV